MTQLFIRFYLSVLAVLFLAWWIYGVVSQSRFEADRARIVVAAHASGLRLVAHELRSAPWDERAAKLDELKSGFRCPLTVLPLADLPTEQQRALRNIDDATHWRVNENGDAVLVRIDELFCLQFGPFPEYTLNAIEDTLAGWMLLAKQRIEDAEDGPSAMNALQREFQLGIEEQSTSALPEFAKQRLDSGRPIAFFRRSNQHWYASVPRTDASKVLTFGAFPEFVGVERPAATTTLALVLLPAALAIALLLRPVANQLRKVERAAQAIAGGNTSARVDEKQIGSARELAKAFNHMASRTETMLRTQRELLQAVSHELKTPLARLRFSMDLVETASDATQRQQRLKTMDDAVEDLRGLVDELINYVRSEGTEMPLRRESLGVCDALSPLVCTYQELSPQLCFEIECADDCRAACIDADRMAFQRAVGNLLSNAHRFAHSQVLVRVHRDTPNSDRHGPSSRSNGITIAIEDDGPGIPVAEREHVFEPFVRLETQDYRSGHAEETAAGIVPPPHAGVGLGLAIVQRIVQQHGGDVWIETAPSGGCRIGTRWPMT
jgi:two-component system sensor histidine kinase RstB